MVTEAVLELAVMAPEPAAHSRSKRPSAPPPQEELAREVAQVELAGRRCRIMLVDGILPTHSTTGRNSRVRLTYLRGEIGHFDFEGHCYALVPIAPRLTECSPLGSSKTDDIRALLTSRELQVVELVCMGCLTKQVADRLHISEFTVRSYLKNVYAKLGVRSRAALVCRYMQAFRDET
jgi:DNA-binding CsgD family transcriptional regulator